MILEYLSSKKFKIIYGVEYYITIGISIELYSPVHGKIGSHEI